MREKKKPITVVYHGHETSGVERCNESLEVSGGEFERKIREIMSDIWNARENSQHQALLKVVAEAKADFPDVVEPLPTFKGCIEYSLLVKRWRDKWFGGREVEQGEKP